jgi:hypothetical protein
MWTVEMVWAWFRVVCALVGVLAMTTPTAPAVLPFALLLTSTLEPRSQTRILPVTLAGSRYVVGPSAGPKHRFRLGLAGSTPGRPASLARISGDDGVFALPDAPVTVTPLPRATSPT